MNKVSKYSHARRIFGLVSILSMSLLSHAPFEANPQDCEMVSVVKKRRKGRMAERATQYCK
jgi:hypothetical protein